MIDGQTLTREGTLGVGHEHRFKPPVLEPARMTRFRSRLRAGSSRGAMRGGRMESVESAPVSLVMAGLEAFAAAARGRTPYPAARQEMIATISALEATIKSAASGQIEQVEG